MTTYTFGLTHNETGRKIGLKRAVIDLDAFKRLLADEGFSVNWTWEVR
jgi:hypothetical protein